MSDEEYGRAWAAMMGIPLHGRSYRGATQHNGADKAWHWRRAETPKLLHNEMRFCSCCAVSICDFDSQSEACAALGKAVRAVHAAVPMLATAPGAVARLVDAVKEAASAPGQDWLRQQLKLAAALADLDAGKGGGVR